MIKQKDCRLNYNNCLSSSLCNLSGLKEHRHSRASDSKLSELLTTTLKLDIFWEK